MSPQSFPRNPSFELTVCGFSRLANQSATKEEIEINNLPKIIRPSNSLVKQSSLTEDLCCGICLEFCTQPVKTPCGHVFCLQCQRKLLESANHSCPLCRTNFDSDFQPKIDIKLQQEIKQQDSENFIERKSYLMDIGQWESNKESNKDKFRLVFGNQYEPYDDPLVKHRFSMFFSIDNNIDLTFKYLRSVTYHLHPFYGEKAKQVLFEPPFLLTRLTPAPFIVLCVVAFQPWTCMSDIVLRHPLKLEEQGKVY